MRGNGCLYGATCKRELHVAFWPTDTVLMTQMAAAVMGVMQCVAHCVSTRIYGLFKSGAANDPSSRSGPSARRQALCLCVILRAAYLAVLFSGTPMTRAWHAATGVFWHESHRIPAIQRCSMRANHVGWRVAAQPWYGGV